MICLCSELWLLFKKMIFLLSHVYCKVCFEHVYMQEELNNIAISASTDNPEGGLDALLQVAACPEVCQV